MNLDPAWMPSRVEQRLLWWTRRLCQVVGLGGVCYSVFIEPNPLAVLAFWGLGMGIDVGTLAVLLVRLGMEERAELGARLEQQRDPEPETSSQD